MTQNWDVFAQRCVEQNIAVQLNAPMAMRTTYAVGGAASAMVTVASEADAIAVASILHDSQISRVVVIGRGSNVLISDSGFDGVVVLLAPAGKDNVVQVEGEVLTVGASVLMPVLARRSVGALRGGLEWCVGIPGTVGGAVRMNAGGHGAEMIDSLVDVQMVSLKSGQVRTVPVESLGLHFRGSALSAHHVVLSVRLRTTETTVEKGTALINSIVSWRREHQPGGRNAGSVFVNPSPGEGSAGALIDASQLRGFAVGGASVSDKHANFIQASDTATAEDVLAVMSHVQKTIAETNGVLLRSEVALVGFDEAVTQQFSDPRHTAAEHQAKMQQLCELMGESDE